MINNNLDTSSIFWQAIEGRCLIETDSNVVYISDVINVDKPIPVNCPPKFILEVKGNVGVPRGCHLYFIVFDKYKEFNMSHLNPSTSDIVIEPGQPADFEDWEYNYHEKLGYMLDFKQNMRRLEYEDSYNDAIRNNLDLAVYWDWELSFSDVTAFFTVNISHFELVRDGETVVDRHIDKFYGHVDGDIVVQPGQKVLYEPPQTMSGSDRGGFIILPIATAPPSAYHVGLFRYKDQVQYENAPIFQMNCPYHIVQRISNYQPTFKTI